MENISVNELVESSSSDIPRELKLTFAKNILSTHDGPPPEINLFNEKQNGCLLYTSPSPRDRG